MTRADSEHSEREWLEGEPERVWLEEPRCPCNVPQQFCHGCENRAREQGVSLNQLVVALLAGGIGFTMEET